MAKTVNFGSGIQSQPAQPWQLDTQGLNRKQALMDALMAQNMTPTPIQTVSGRVINNGLLDGFTKIATAAMLKHGYEQNDRQRSEIQKQQLASQNAAFGEFAGARANNPMDFLRNAQAVAAKHGIGIGELLSNPAVASQLKVMEDRAKGQKLGKGDQWVDGDGNVIAKGAPDLMSVAPGSSIVDPNNPASPLFKNPDKPLMVESGAGSAPNGDPLVTHMLVDPTTRQAASISGLQPVQKGPLAKVSASASVQGDNEFAKEVGKKVGERVVARATEAEGASGTLQRISTIRDALATGKVMAGPGANAEIVLAQVGSRLGFNNATALAETRKAIQGMAGLELEAANQMKGQGQITQPERELIKRAAAGDITMTLPEIEAALDATEKVSRLKIRANAAAVQTIKKNPQMQNTPVELLDVPEPPQTRPGRRVKNPQTGEILEEQNGKWVKVN